MDNSRDYEGATVPFDAALSRAKNDSAKHNAAASAHEAMERLRLELLVTQVTAQILVRPIPMTSAADLHTWATDRARNIIAGLQGSGL